MRGEEGHGVGFGSSIGDLGDYWVGWRWNVLLFAEWLGRRRVEIWVSRTSGKCENSLEEKRGRDVVLVDWE